MVSRPACKSAAKRNGVSAGPQDYSFNKSHAACYALIAHRTAWLRAHHPREYMAALISSVMNTKDRVPFYVAACAEMGIEVLPPDVNSSAHDFAVAGRDRVINYVAEKYGRDRVAQIITFESSGMREALRQVEADLDRLAQIFGDGDTSGPQARARPLELL